MSLKQRRIFILADQLYMAKSKTENLPYNHYLKEATRMMESEYNELFKKRDNKLKEVSYLSSLRVELTTYYSNMIKKLDNGQGFTKRNITIKGVNFKSLSIKKNLNGEVLIELKYKET